jgi:hypothetical protein
MGDVLINNGTGGFTWIGAGKSGLNLRGQLRDIKEIHGHRKDYLLFLQNDEYPVLYQVNDKIKN